MSDYKHITPFILQSEGGQSSAITDAASKWPRPAGVGAVHTNKGITWQAFQATTKCDEGAASCQQFLEMKYETWLTVWKRGYWDAVRASEINSQRIADLVAWWAWGSGAGTAIKQVQQVLKRRGIALSVDGQIGTFTLAAINNDNEPALYWAIYQARIDFIFAICKNNPYNEVNKQGWINALVHYVIYQDINK